MIEQGEVEAIFLAVLDRRTPEERDAYVAEVCAGKPDLLHRVRELLASHQQSRGPLDAAPPGLGATVDLPGRGEGPGTKVGHYKLLQQIGEGGMGTVFMAEQTQPVQRKVALKVTRPGMDSQQVIARFEAERQALALMDHPNIAKVLDAGTTETGRPYFVMELVKGVPITRYCDENRLTPRERLELFIPVCQAVQHAHQKGIIHRDLKPSNVLVARYDGKPVPKVIDFGIAKATGQKLTERTLFTEFGAVVGTLEYMSPEQAELNQLDIDTRSDIYSLGVLLYELLTGTTPLERQRLSAGALLEALRIIREEEPPKPSTRLSTAEGLPTIAANRGLEPGKLSGVVRGELDWVVMKCLSKDRNRRYDTPNGLAQDLEHFLRNEPVSAGPPSVWYQFRKFVQRHKRALATAGLLGLMLLAGVGGVAASLAYAARDRSARIAVAEGKTTAALDEADGLQRKRQWPEALEAARRAQGLLPQDGSEQLRERVRETLKDINMVLTLADIRLPNAKEGVQGGYDPEVANRAYAEAFRAYGIDVEALEPAETARLIRDRAIHLELILAVDHWAVHLPDAARMKRLAAVARAADSDDWRNQIRDAWVEDDRDALCKLAVSPRIRELPMQSLSLLGFVLKDREALQLLRMAVQAYPDDGELNGQLGWVLDHATGKDREDLIDVVRFYTARRALQPRNVVVTLMLGDKLDELGKFDEATSVYRRAFELRAGDETVQKLAGALLKQGKVDEAVALCSKFLALNPNNRDTLFRLGCAYGELGRWDEAIAVCGKALELDPDYHQVLHELGCAYLGAGESRKALPFCEQAFAKSKEKLGPEARDTLRCMGTLAVAYQANGRQKEAMPLYEQTLAKSKEKFGPDDPETLGSLNNLAMAYFNNGRLKEALPLFEQAFAKLKEKIGPDHPDTLLSMHNLASAYRVSGRLKEALALLEQTLAKRKEKLGPDHPHTLLSMNNLALAYHDDGRLKEALALFEETLAKMKKTLGPDHPHTLLSMGNLAEAYHAAGKFGRAEPLLRELLKRQVKREPGSLAAGSSLAQLGMNLLLQKKYADAEPLLRECLAIRTRHAPDDWLTFNARSMLGAALAGLGKYADAAPLLIEGYEGMKQREARIPSAGKVRLTEALERLVALYEATGQKDKAAAWRKKLDERQAPPKKPSP
jgi:serine/threonine protein kinase/tetratricopeptide (TPR) repeat protein